MGAVLLIVDDDFKVIESFGYLADPVLQPIVEKADDLGLPYIGSILYYENTLFNSCQRERMRPEIQKLRSSGICSAKVSDGLREIERACDYADSEDLLYVLFSGD